MNKRFWWCLLTALTLSVAGLTAARAADDPPADDDGRVKLVAKARAREGGKLTFLWTQVEGPPVKVADASAARLDESDPEKRRWISETFYIPTEPGRYVFKLSVRNEDGQESTKVFPATEVLPPKPPPVAVAGPDQNGRTVGDLVRLNGSDSKANDGGAITKWEWSLVQGPPKFKPDPKQLQLKAWDFKAEEAGVYQFDLRVYDGKRWSAPASLTVTVHPKSQPPEIIDEPDTTTHKKELTAPGPEVTTPSPKVYKAVVAMGREAKVGETLVLDGSASNPPAESHPDFFWHQSDEKGPMARQLQADRSKAFDPKREDTMNYPVWTFKPTEPGLYRFALEIALNDGSKKESEIVTYTVVDPNAAATAPQPPPPPVAPAANGALLSAHITAERVNVDAGDTVRLDASKSSPEGAKLKFVWGPVAGKLHPKKWSGDDGPLVEFTAEEEGEYGVSLRVVDGDKESPPDQIIITVGPPNKPPVIDLPATYEAAVGEKLTLEAKVTDPEGDKFNLKWVCLDPPDLKIKGKDGNIDLSTLPSLVFTPWKPGHYVFRLNAMDAKGHASKAETTITVKPTEVRQPTAKIVGPETAVTGKKVTLDGSKSVSAMKGTLSYNWRQVQGPQVPGDAPNFKQNKWEFTPTAAGHYEFTLEVTDGTIKSPSDKFVLEVAEGAHAAPIAKIAGGANVKIDENETLILDGSESSAPEHGKLTFKWSKIDGDADVKIDDAETPKAKVSAPNSGTARVQLVVNDGATDSAPAIVTLAFAKGKLKPVAKITGPTTATAGSTVILTGTESTADGEISSYVWKQEGPKIEPKLNLRRKELRFEPKLPGTYVFTLTVLDSKGIRSEAVTQSLEVQGPVQPPHASASLLREDNDAPAIGKVVKLNARGSLDPQGGTLKYKWKQVTGEPITLPDEKDMGEILPVVPPAAGKYVFELTVNNGKTDSPAVAVEFDVAGPHTPPVAKIAEIVAGEPGEKVVLDGTGSTTSDPAGKLEFRWTKTTGGEVKYLGRNAESRPKLELLPQADGEYVFELKVFDGKEWSEPVQAAFKTRAQNVAPTALVAIPNNSRELHTEEGMETVLDGSLSSDPDNGPKPLTYLWKQLDGPRVELKTDAALARFTPPRVGTMKFQLVVNDGKSSSAPALVTVVVLKAGTMPVAVPDFSPKPAKAANRALRNNLLILDGTKSKPNKKLTYQWKQIGGEDLHLPADRLNKDRVGLLVYNPGVYKFALTVSDDLYTSQPTVLEINVVDESGAAAPAPAPSNPEATEKKKAPEKSDAPPPQDTKAPTDTGHQDGALLPPPRDAEKTVPTETADKPANSDQAALRKKLDDLAKTPGPEADRALVEALGNTDKDIRNTAVEAFYRRGVTSIPALIGALDSPSSMTRNVAYAALKELTHETFGPESAKWKDWWAAQPAAKSASSD